ncbi:MAG: EFR1 family ferrodoxin [Desulfuromonas sp.]|nr:EFR1 family ferrodoxin [Desulfuromonas sp.]
MTESVVTHCVAYLSPAGTTKQVAEVIVRHLKPQGIDPLIIDLSAEDYSFAQLEGPCCLWLGSPVYVDHILPQVCRFISSLPQGQSHYAAPFVTWGAVCSGVALPEMAQQLAQQGWQTVGAAKVLAVHSSLWQSRHPLGAGHPDAADLAQVSLLVEGVLQKLKSALPQPLAEEVFHYLSAEQEQLSWQKSLDKAKTMLGEHQPVVARCDGCGACVTACPVAAIDWRDNEPYVTERCIRCHQCTRLCPQQAFAWDGAAVEERLRRFAAASEEAPGTEVFV